MIPNYLRRPAVVRAAVIGTAVLLAAAALVGAGLAISRANTTPKLAGVNHAPGNPAGNPAAHPSEPGTTDHAAGPSDAARPSASTRFVAVRQPSDPSLLEAPGILRADASSSGELSALQRLMVQRVLVQVGERVEKGQPLVEVLCPDVQQAAASLVSAASLRQAHATRAKELEQLRGEGLATQAEVLSERMQERASEAEQLRSAATLAAAGLKSSDAAGIVGSGHWKLRAPVAGIVTELAARPGATYDGGGAPLLRVVGTGGTRVEVHTASGLPSISAADFVTLDGRTFRMATEPLNQVVSPNDGTRTSWYALIDAPPLQDGLRGSVRVHAASDVWEVPLGALGALTTGSARALQRLRAQQTETISVRVLAASGSSAWVTGDLREGDRVAEAGR
ncbi:MAG TPA: efflux RND transporter periplasmic adaptor subunit [Polyangiaceae bacterium]|nr:efflux RND transporter periplasmic adaptor subunit [Polyangiaceae bacterium]